MTTRCLLLSVSLLLLSCQQHPPDPIRVGVLHSWTGTMAVSEPAVAEATLMAIEEIDAAGGLLGRQLKPVKVDGESDPQQFALAAERLIVEEKVDVIFGGWTSASRKEMKAVVEEHQHLLFYPVQYEGMEGSAHIVYLGAAPNQQLLPALKWFIDNRGTRFFLIGSSYIYPHCANATASDYIEYLGGKVVGEHYMRLGSNNAGPAVEAIKNSGAQVIINTLNGSSNWAFFDALRAAEIRSIDIPTLSLSLSEEV